MPVNGHIPELDINLPPNFDIYAKNSHVSNNLNIQIPKRLGEHNPQTIPCLGSNMLNFQHTEMSRLDLDNLLHPHTNDIQQMSKEIE